ncbi:MAG: hypothetical protein ACHQ49_12430 [Elusimicrobiota bacterium]
MKSTLLVLGALTIFVAGSSAARAAEGTCVDCHRRVKDTSMLAHNFVDWQVSVHAKSGIECQSCHGGDAAQAGKAEAHAGMIPSTNAKSPVYYTQIPETCGKCHAEEFAAFRKSAHFKELQGSGRGPNCVTCHGAMSSHVIDSQSMQATCSLCHHQPLEAYQARAAMEEAQDALHRLNGEIQAAGAAGFTDPAGTKKIYLDLADSLHKAKVDWHAFQTAKVLASVQDISRKAEAAFTELKSKNKAP